MLNKKNQNTLFTTPSHGGKLYLLHKFYQWYKADISETDTHLPQENLKKSEAHASYIYGTKYTKFLTNGSTSGIITAILASQAKKILIWDKAHPCHENGAKLSGAEIFKYSLPFDKDLGIYRAITLENVEILLNKNNVDALIITSPTYEGFATNVEKIANLCHKKGVILIVDEAHGALYPFSDLLPQSAVKYADYTVQSLHKTAGGLNPTALLHSNLNDPTEMLNRINTTSPSYPMLASIEANVKFLNSKKGRKKINQLIQNIKNLNISQLNDDPTKILLKGGHNLSEKLFKKYKIEDERTNEKTTMLLCGIGTDIKKLNRLKKALKDLFI